MRFIKRLLFIVFLFLPALSLGAGKSVENEYISIYSLKGFDMFKLTLSKIVGNLNSDDKRDQHFYIAKYDPNVNYTYMYWAEKTQLWKIYPSPDYVTEYDWEGLQYPSGGEWLDLKTDVVLTVEEMGSSTYLETKAWAADKLFDAVVNGDLVTIKP